MTPDIITTTAAVDPVFFFIFGVCAVMLLGISVAMLWFVIRYNRKRCPEPLSQKDNNLWLEVTWTVIPTILVLLMFWYGWAGYLSLRRVPDGAMPVTANARMWSWQFVYENGKSSDRLYVPVGQPVKVKLVAKDVLHAFYAPAFRVKRDAVPGMANYVWFVADKVGSYDLFCAEYCGVGHADMTTTIEALPPDEFADWLAAATKMPDGKPDGAELFSNNGCTGCHSIDGSESIGPTLKGLSLQPQIDRDYLRRALLTPAAELAPGYAPLMPAFDFLSDAELNALLDYLERL